MLAFIRHTGVEPEIVPYLATPLSKRQLRALLAVMGITVRELLRQKGTPYDGLGLGDLTLSDDALLDAMTAHPILMNRPIVQTPLGTRLCRPSEKVLDILPWPQREALAKNGDAPRPGSAC